MTDHPASGSTTPDPPSLLRRYRLGEEPGDNLAEMTTAEERVAMVEVLSARMWELTGRPSPTYTRATMPVRLTFLG